LLRNLDRLRQTRARVEAPEPAREPGLADSGASPDDWPTIALDILAGALHLSELGRGLISLRVPGSGARFRVLHRLGFDDDTADVSALLRVMGHTIRRGRGTQLSGDLLDSSESDLGTTLALPLLADGATLGALVLDDPQRVRPLSETAVARLQAFVNQTASVLSLRLVQSARPERRASA
jgi:hypothetical protein